MYEMISYKPNQAMLAQFDEGAITPDTMTKQEKVIVIITAMQKIRQRETFELYMVSEQIKGLADNTLKVYLKTLKYVQQDSLAFPMSEQDLAMYIDHLFNKSTTDDKGNIHKLRPSTIAQRIAAISKLHEWLELPNPNTKRVRQVYRNRLHDWSMQGNRQRQAQALLKEDVLALLEAVHGSDKKQLRDTAMLLIGYSGAFRRSELCNMTVENLEFDKHGLVIHLPVTKTKKFGDKKRIVAEPEDSEVCPVRMLRAWLKKARIESGAVWRGIDKEGSINDKQLTTHGFNYVLKQLADSAGLEPEKISGHSLRSGVCTQLAIDGVPTYKIQRLGGWANLHMLHDRYLRDVEMVTDNAASQLWKDAKLTK